MQHMSGHKIIDGLKEAVAHAKASREEDIVEAREEGRRDGLEEAAKIAEQVPWTGTGMPKPSLYTDEIVAAIRAAGKPT